MSPELCLGLSALSIERAQGRPGADRHPRSAARNAHAGRTAQQHTGGAAHAAFPARWSDGLCRALPGAEFLLASLASRIDDALHPVGLPAPPRQLDRSDDGQDHTVLPYAHPLAPQGSTASCTSHRHVGATNFTAPLIRTRVSGSQGLPALPAPSRADAAASTASPARDHDDVRSPLKVEPGWSTHTPIPNFGKVEYFCGCDLTAPAGVLPVGRSYRR